MSPDSDEFVVELMTQCELKLQILHEELQGKDLAAIMKEMEEEEVSQKLHTTHPASECFELQVVVLDHEQMQKNCFLKWTPGLRLCGSLNFH